jgi:hypothetical protein
MATEEDTIARNTGINISLACPFAPTSPKIFGTGRLDIELARQPMFQMKRPRDTEDARNGMCATECEPRGDRRAHKVTMDQVRRDGLDQRTQLLTRASKLPWPTCGEIDVH